MNSAPSRGPVTVPRPPIATAARKVNDSSSVNDSGATNPSAKVNSEPATPA
jgi:hypothetical protein